MTFWNIQITSSNPCKWEGKGSILDMQIPSMSASPHPVVRYKMPHALTLNPMASVGPEFGLDVFKFIAGA